MIRRRFVDIEEGQVHMRVAGENNGGRPLVMFHPSPGSSKSLTHLIEYFSKSRFVIAPDTLGNGDSPAPVDRSRNIIPYAEAQIRVLDAMGIEEFDLYGSHTGGCIASEVAIAHPDRVKTLTLDGMSNYARELREDMLVNYAPGIKVDFDGQHIQWIWNFVRDTYIYWPWYKRDREHLRNVKIPSPEALHDKAIEVLKAARTYHLPYNAAIAYPKGERLPLVRVPTLLICGEDDMLFEYFHEISAMLKNAETIHTPGYASNEDAQATMKIVEDYLDRHTSN